jgi:hypothetical protein
MIGTQLNIDSIRGKNLLPVLVSDFFRRFQQYNSLEYPVLV